MLRSLPALSLLALAAACAPGRLVRETIPAPVMPAPVMPPEDPASGAAPPAVDPRTAAQNFVAVVDRMEPVVEAECRRSQPAARCDFLIAVDDRPGQPPNAYQSVDRDGRPVLAFTLALIADARNRDEVAFVLGHEAAHHIEGHLPRTRQSAMAGAMILGTLATLSGAGAEQVESAQQLGADVGARSYSRIYELEADRMGSILAWRAGYDPARGAAFFRRLPDPGDRFLGTHPPTAERQNVVWTTIGQLEAGTLR